MKKIHIFKTGKHTASCGTVLSFGETELAASAKAYDPAIHEAPIVVGHPSENGPAFGWIRGLDFAEGNLDAQPDQVNADFEELVQQGAYKKVSASFYSPDAPTNPVPGTWYLRHVGFLGAQPPAIKGLKAIGFSEGEPGIIEFSSADTNNWVTAEFMRNIREWILAKFGKEDADEVVPSYMVGDIEDAARHPTPEPDTSNTSNDPEPDPVFKEPKPKGTDTMTPEEIAAKEAELAAKEASFSEREERITATEKAITLGGIKKDIDALVAAGKVLPAETDKLASFMSGIDADSVVEFKEDDKDQSQPARAFLVSMLEAMPARVDFSEHSKDDGKDDGKAPNSADLAQRAVQYQEALSKTGITVSITQAVNDCMAGKDKA